MPVWVVPSIIALASLLIAILMYNLGTYRARVDLDDKVNDKIKDFCGGCVMKKEVEHLATDVKDVGDSLKETSKDLKQVSKDILTIHGEQKVMTNEMSNIKSDLMALKEGKA